MRKALRTLGTLTAAASLFMGSPSLRAETAAPTTAPNAAAQDGTASGELNLGPLYTAETLPLDEYPLDDTPAEEAPAPEAAAPAHHEAPTAAVFAAPTDNEMDIYSSIAGSELNEADQSFLTKCAPAARIAIVKLAAAVNKRIVNRSWKVRPGQSQLSCYLYDLSQDALVQLQKMNRKNIAGAKAAIDELSAQAPMEPSAIYVMENIAWDTLLKKYTTKINGDVSLMVKTRAEELATDYGIEVTGLVGGALGEFHKSPKAKTPKPVAKKAPAPDGDMNSL